MRMKKRKNERRGKKREEDREKREEEKKKKSHGGKAIKTKRDNEREINVNNKWLVARLCEGKEKYSPNNTVTHSKKFLRVPD